ncbi:MAG TPA: hypothetical protein VHM19_05000, partial [Polyangiales bacterium]|nr:hypothetical protein [Polyangiales bacterium]
GFAVLGLFAVAVVLHARTLGAQTRARVRRDVHSRHVLRSTGGFTRLPFDGSDLLPRDHPYARDIDLIGHASLFQRIDVTHTREGERLLASWLGRAAEREVILSRQAAVRELAARLDFREDLEAAAGELTSHKLDASNLDALLRLPATFEEKPWLRAVVIVLPAITVALALGSSFGLVPNGLWLLPSVFQMLLLMSLAQPVRRAIDLVAAKLPVFEGFEQLLLLVERSKFDSPHLGALAQRIAIGHTPPSSHLKRIARWAGFAELRQNPLFHVIANAFVLWDLHVLWGIERFVAEVGKHSSDWFSTIGELEALSSLATLAYADVDATFPELADPGGAFSATAIGHPLLLPHTRIANDVTLRGPGTALVITGSNMAGKSTLLRAVGQNLALSLCGGPVIAAQLRAPLVRLRASMRAEDSLESGASYFHAELSKLKTVVAGAEQDPPVFFLLDELLRGTNARARHVGGKAVLMHLIERRGTGLVATHDVELAALATQFPERIDNVHFTDVVEHGEMKFDYKLRPGIVRTSNALRLLALAGIDVPEQDRDAVTTPSVRPAATTERKEAR